MYIYKQIAYKRSGECIITFLDVVNGRKRARTESSKILFFYSFTPNFTDTRLDTRNLLLRHSVYKFKFQLYNSAFRGLLEVLLVKWRNSMPCFASSLEQVNENMKYYFLEWESNPRPVALKVACAFAPRPPPYVCFTCIQINRSIMGKKKRI